MQLVFATNNPHKLHEIRSKVGNGLTILSLSDIGCSETLPEPHDTLEENATSKAMYVYEKYNVNCFADDTGLEIAALDGRPGVMSARYAGGHCSPQDNMAKVLKELEGVTDRSARFRTVISVVIEGFEELFEGSVSGNILTGARGTEGFGYDPIFVPEGYVTSFAEMPLHEKNRVSHRGKAVALLVKYLKELSV